MKKIFGFLICLLVLNACDDGDLVFDTFDFSESDARFCADNNLLYKINGNEALVIQINSTNANDIFPYRNVLGTKTIPLSSDNKIFYRTFSSTVDGATYFCSAIPPVSPTVTSEYVSQPTSNGRIEITTTLVPGATTLAAAEYNHTIIFKNITFTNSQGGTIVYDELIFGTYQTPSQVEFAFNSLPVRTCATQGKYFKVIDSNLANSNEEQNLNKILEINIPTSEFPTLIAQPKRVFLNEANNITAFYRIYNGDVPNEDYCAAVATLNKYEEWKAQDGLDEVEDPEDIGYFEITASNDPDNPGEIIYNVILKKFNFTRAFPVDDSGSPAATFTNTTDINFGQIKLP